MKGYVDISAEGKTFLLDLNTGQLYRERQERIKVTNQQWLLLTYLIDQSPRLISKSELLIKVWNNAPITDDAISQTVRNIRHMLNDQHSKAFVQTEHGRGYRFVGNINRTESNSADIGSESGQVEELENALIDEYPSRRSSMPEKSLSINKHQAELISDAIAKWSGSLDDKLIEHLNRANIQIGTISNIVDRLFSDVGYKNVEKGQIADKFKEIAERYISYEEIQGYLPVASVEDIINGVSVFERVVILINGKNLDGEVIWSYLQLTLESLQRLKDTVTANQNFEPAHFGKVLAFGVGEVPAEVEEEMRILHNMIPVPKPERR